MHLVSREHCTRGELPAVKQESQVAGTHRKDEQASFIFWILSATSLSQDS